MHALMCEHSCATVVISATGTLTADDVPLVLHDGVGECGILRGHAATANPLLGQTRDKPSIEVLAIF